MQDESHTPEDKQALSIIKKYRNQQHNSYSYFNTDSRIKVSGPKEAKLKVFTLIKNSTILLKRQKLEILIKDGYKIMQQYGITEQLNEYTLNDNFVNCTKKETGIKYKLNLTQTLETKISI